MKRKSSTQAVLAFMQDAQQLKRVYGWCNPVVQFYSDYLDVEYRTYDIFRSIPEHHADEWRLFAYEGEIHFLLTYYYDPETA